jgi:hypothetical protein
MDNWMIYIFGSLVAGMLILIGIGSRYWLGPDNKIEETVEIITFDTIGKRVDLSPDTPDPDDTSLSIKISEEDYQVPDDFIETKKQKSAFKEKIDENFSK